MSNNSPTRSTINVSDPRAPFNSRAIAAFVLSILIPLVGLPFAFIALQQIEQTHERGTRLAIAAIIISIVLLLVQLFLWLAAFGVFI